MNTSIPTSPNGSKTTPRSHNMVEIIINGLANSTAQKIDRAHLDGNRYREDLSDNAGIER